MKSMRFENTDVELITLQNFETAHKPINSPRALEACLRTGVDPATLLPKPLSYFKKKYKKDEIVLMHHNYHENKRQERLKKVHKERAKVLQALEYHEYVLRTQAQEAPEEQKRGSSFRTSTRKAKGSGGKVNKLDLAASDLATKAAAQLEKEKNRQKRELQQMIAYELKLAEKEQQARHKAEMQRLRTKQQEREKERCVRVVEEISQSRASVCIYVAN